MISLVLIFPLLWYVEYMSVGWIQAAKLSGNLVGVGYSELVFVQKFLCNNFCHQKNSPKPELNAPREISHRKSHTSFGEKRRNFSVPTLPSAGPSRTSIHKLSERRFEPHGK